MLRDLVVKNRSYRGFDESRRVTKEELLELVDLTRFSASSVNKQPLKYYISYEKEEVDILQKHTRWARALPQLDLPYPGTCPTAFIIICQDTSISSNMSVFLRDVGVVAQTITLGAVEMGLGGCMIGNFDKADVKEMLGFDEPVEPILMIAIGKPDEEIILTEVGEDGNTNYYRDESGKKHFVPKRKLEDILLDRK